MKNLLTPVLVILALVVGYFYVLPLYDHVSLLKEKQNKHVELLESVRGIQGKIANLENQYNSFTPRERGLLTRLIPREAKETVITNDITALAETHGLVITAAEFETAELPDQNIQSIGDESDSVSGSRFEKWNSTIHVQGSYDGFKDFLTDLGRSIRIADVSHISIRQNETGGRGLAEYKITATIYSLE